MKINGWEKHLSHGLLDQVLYKLDEEYMTKSILPPKPLVFEAFRQCPLNQCKVVMLAQDPYPQKGYATGLAFANPKDVKISPSLRLIRERIIADFRLTSNDQFDQTLVSWANRGMLLLNTALTVEENKPGTHVAIWQSFIADFLQNLSNSHPGMIYMLVGGQAAGFEKYINPLTSHILKYKHPAYFCRIGKEFECNGFLKIQSMIKNMYNEDFKFEQ